jgi:SET domain-containing protein
VDVEEPEVCPWVEEALVVAGSRISGAGLFASDHIEAGRVVIRLGGRLVSTSELQDLLVNSSRYVDTLTVCDDVHLVLPPGTKVHYGNHSCDPNLWHAGPYEIVARRDIEAWEEVTVDYGTQSGAPGFFMGCSCGADVCRGVVTSEDWRLLKLQTVYAGHWVPALEERIRQQT